MPIPTATDIAFALGVLPQPDIAAQGTLGVLAGSVVAIVVGGVLTAVRSRAAR